MFIFESDRTNLTSMKSIDWLNESINYHMQKLKKTEKTKIMKLLQLMSQYSVKTLGVSFMSNKTMASLLKVTVRTIQRYTKEMEELGILFKFATKRKNGGQTSNTYVIKPVIKSSVAEACHGGCHAINPSTKHKQDNSNILYNINSANNINSVEDYKILQLIKLKLKDRNIKYISSYIDKMLDNHELYVAKQNYHNRLRAERQQLKEQLRQNKIPMYNWLES